LLVVERCAETPSGMADVATKEITKSAEQGRDVVLDLPAACLWQGKLRAQIDIALAPVGPTGLDEHAAALVLSQGPIAFDPRGRSDRKGSGNKGDAAARPVWLLGCGRGGGGPAAARFRLSIAAAFARTNGTRPRVLPIVMPSLSPADAEALLAGLPRPWTKRAGFLALAALRAVQKDPFGEEVSSAAVAAELGTGDVTTVTRDDRDQSERLRELADALQAIQEGEKPVAADLAAAPLLEEWSYETRSVPVLAGRVFGHPTIPDGRHIVTSDLYACDGARWALSLSRFYHLGSPAQRRGRSKLQ
jgi:hypothetical protein